MPHVRNAICTTYSPPSTQNSGFSSSPLKSGQAAPWPVLHMWLPPPTHISPYRSHSFGFFFLHQNHWTNSSSLKRVSPRLVPGAAPACPRSWRWFYFVLGTLKAGGGWEYPSTPTHNHLYFLASQSYGVKGYFAPGDPRLSRIANSAPMKASKHRNSGRRFDRCHL